LNGVLQFVSFNLLNGWQFEQTEKDEGQVFAQLV